MVTNSAKHMGLLMMYSLASISKKPKSGYELMKEISEKTEHKWRPSKGTLYPILTQLESESLISVNRIGKRGKKIFEITKKGKDELKNFHKLEEQKKEELQKFQNILNEIFGKDVSHYRDHLISIKKLVLSAHSKNKDKVIKILKKCTSDLKKLK